MTEKISDHNEPLREQRVAVSEQYNESLTRLIPGADPDVAKLIEFVQERLCIAEPIDKDEHWGFWLKN